MSLLLQPDQSVLLVVDIQDKFRSAILEMDRVIQRTAQLIQGSNLLDIPVIVTEQYPKGLGHTVDELKAHLKDSTSIIEKTTFGAMGTPEVSEELGQLGRKQVIVCGIEAHVCVNQTVMELLTEGYSVFLVEDAISSRRASDYQTALKKFSLAHAVPVSTEMVLFEWLGDAKHPQFKAMQQVILSV